MSAQLGAEPHGAVAERSARIAAEYVRLLGRAPTGWEANARLREPFDRDADLGARILCSPEYDDELRSVLGKCYACLLGEALPKDHDTGALRAALGTGGICSAEIRRYVARMPEFVRRYETIINHYLELQNRTVPEYVRRALVARFAHIENYDFDSLLEDICNNNFPPEAFAAPGVAAEQAANAGGGGKREVPRGRVADALAYVAAWRHANDVAPDACELARFLEEKPRAGIADMRQLKDDVDDAHSQAALMYRAYLDEPLPRSDFLCDWIMSYDSPDFCTDILESVVMSDAYVEKTRARITAVHHAAYACALHPDDLEYCFAVVRCERLALHADRISTIVIDTMTALLGIEDRVDAIFGDVLERKADDEEKRDNVARFRYAESAQSAEDGLRYELHESLEFHDVLKARIDKRFRETTGARMTPKRLYEMLAGVIAKHRGRMIEYALPDAF
jgi:hypothetical protein